MTPAERKRMVVLCQQLEGEQEPKKFSDLLSELLNLLEHTGHNVQVEVSQPAKPDMKSAE